MKLVRYVCTHCSKKFEAEEKEVLECPGCFWSTSVKREEDLTPASVTSAASRPSFKLKLPAVPWKPIAGLTAAILVLFFGLKFLNPLFQKAAQMKPEKKPKAEQAAVSSEAATPTTPAGLSPEEQNSLSRRVQISADRNPSDEEQKILDARASFKTGFSEKLPSQAWTKENFDEMIRQQERFYKVPLPGSYKGKLKEHFEKIYLPGAEAFKNGDLIQARNAWVEALAVPVYSNDPQKHRAVVLTMIRPFINDTLSKIGTINSTLVEKTIRDQEQQAAAGYQKFISLIQEKKWKDALSAADELDAKLNVLSNPKGIAGGPADYPAAFARVDRDIQAPLSELRNVPPPALSDLEPVHRDILAKRKVMESFDPEKLAEKQMAYDAALESIGRQEWAEAKKKLAEMDTPVEMRRDALEKIKIINKLLNPVPSRANLNAGPTDEANRRQPPK